MYSRRLWLKIDCMTCLPLVTPQELGDAMHSICQAHIRQQVRHCFFLALALGLISACMGHAGSQDGRAGEGGGLQEGGQVRVDLMQPRFVPAVMCNTPYATRCCACVSLISCMQLLVI